MKGSGSTASLLELKAKKEGMPLVSASGVACANLYKYADSPEALYGTIQSQSQGHAVARNVLVNRSFA